MRDEPQSLLGYEFRYLSLKDSPQVEVLQQEVSQLLGDNYIPSHPDAVQEMLKQGYSIGFFVEDCLEGLRLIYDRRSLNENMQRVLNLTAGDSQNGVQFCGIYVRERFQKNKIGFQMTKQALSDLWQRERQFVFTTVAPANKASLTNLFRLGFEVRGNYRLENGAERKVLFCGAPSAHGKR